MLNRDETSFFSHVWRRSRAGARAARCGGASAGARRVLGSSGGMQRQAAAACSSMRWLEAAGSSKPLRREHGAAGSAGAPNGEGGPW